MADPRVAAVCTAINQQVEHVMASDVFRQQIADEPPKSGDLIVFNNSFLYREGVKTAKSTKYLCVRVGQEGPELPTYIVEPGTVLMRFKRFRPRSDSGPTPHELEEYVANELDDLGSIVRALVGEIGADEPAEVPVEKVKNCNVLMYEPSQAKIAEVIEGAVAVNRLDDIDVVWQAIKDEAYATSFDIEENFAKGFESKFAQLREAAYRPVDISKPSAESSILSEAITHIDQQADAYSTALANHLTTPDSRESLNDLLRISYNFADGALELMKLIVGMSDMKPILFWLTIGPQSDLADRFGELPFSLVGKAKPSLERYRSVIAGARNHTFHNIFAFGRPFRARLTGDAFQSPELRLFREHSSKRPALDFSDRQLVELLEGFTRAAESPVPLGFWETNLAVMQSLAALARSVLDALLILSSDTP